jgi:hypothetical protein
MALELRTAIEQRDFLKSSEEQMFQEIERLREKYNGLLAAIHEEVGGRWGEPEGTSDE